MTPAGGDATLIGPRLSLGASGGFSLEGPDGFEARPEQDGWSIHGGPFEPGTRLAARSDGGGYALVDAVGDDLGSFSCLVGGTIAEDPPTVTLSDGRVYRVVTSDRGYAVLGRETPGPYVEWVRDGTDWRGQINVAGREIEDLHRLVALVAAAIARDRTREE